MLIAMKKSDALFVEYKFLRVKIAKSQKLPLIRARIHSFLPNSSQFRTYLQNLISKLDQQRNILLLKVL